jgi:serine/threonine protein kinase
MGTNMTMAGGSPQTMVPELLSDDDTYTNKIDVYSFGVCLYMLFRDANHFEGDANPVKHYTTFLKRVSNRCRFVRDPTIPPFYWNLITSCWDHNPNARPSFAQIVEMLRTNKEYAFPGTDMAQLAEYEAKVMPVSIGVSPFVFGRPDTAEPCRKLGGRREAPPVAPPPPLESTESKGADNRCIVA